MKQVLLWSGVGLLVAGGFVLVLTFASPPPSSSLSSSVNPLDGSPILGTAVTGEDHIKGNIESSIVLIEYGDFQCPACGAFFLIVEQIEREFGDQIGIVYRQFPLRNIHKNAEFAARASEAAGLQGKFWAMHDMLFERQAEWSSDRNPQDRFGTYAESLGLDKEQFIADIASEKVIENVENDFQTGLADEVNSTPSFYLEGKKIGPFRSHEELRQVILAALANRAEKEESIQSVIQERGQIDEPDETDS